MKYCAISPLANIGAQVPAWQGGADNAITENALKM
jgi:hypothetical protein